MPCVCAIFASAFTSLGKQETTEADARLQEVRTDSFIETHTARDFLDIRAQPLTNDADFVDETDPRCQEGVGGILDHFGGAYVSG